MEVINETCSEGNAAIVIEVISGTPEYQYSWSANPENNTPSIDSLSGGMHSVTVTDQSGCEVVEEILISNHLPPTATITALNPAHCDQADASVSFVIEGIGDENDFTANWNTTPQDMEPPKKTYLQELIILQSATAFVKQILK